MKIKFLHILFLISILITFSGCIEEKQVEEEHELTKAYSFQQINESLQNGPVLIEMGFDGCPACKVLKPILIEVQSDYQGKATVMYLDTREVPSVAIGFGVGYVPDSFVIVDIENGQYRYVRYDGQITSDRSNARFVGVVRKEILANTLDAAISARQN
jgi:thiol-disulfide isomerase/thioredoxin